MNPPRSVVELLQELVRIPSVNPSGDPGTSAGNTGEKAIAEYIARFLERCGAEATLVEVLPGRPNVIGQFPSNRSGKPGLVFAPHTDTVSVAGMTVEPFGGEISDGRVFGRGSCDTKGPMAAQLWALWENRDLIPSLGYEIWFSGLMDEEAGQAGAAAAAHSLPVAFAVVAEPTSMDIVHTHKGTLWLEILAHGKASHSSKPQAGRNAIYTMSRAIRFIEEEIGPELSAMPDLTLGSPTVSAGLIRGGSKINVVPDHCSLEVDIRTVPGMDHYGTKLVERFKALSPDLDVRIIKQTAPLYTDPAHLIIGALQNTGAALIGAPWFCDAAIFANAGIPSIAIGPGSIDQAHTANEFIEIAALEEGAERFSKFLRAL